jgi:hypothetical protein
MIGVFSCPYCALAVEVDTRAAILDSAAALGFAAGTTAS